MGEDAGVMAAAAEATHRKTQTLPQMGWPAVLSPWRPGANAGTLPKATPQNLRRLAEQPVVRRAVNVVKDRISSMEWQVRLKPEAVADALTASGCDCCGACSVSRIRRTAFAALRSRCWKT